MLDVRSIRQDPDAVKAALSRRDPALVQIVDRILALDEAVRDATTTRDRLRAEINQLSKEVGQAHKAGDKARAEELSQRSKELDAQEKDVTDPSAELRDILLRTPNIPATDAPDGATEHDNVVIRVENEQTYQEHQRVAHWDVATALGILDLQRAARMSGSMFTMMRGAGATLARALCQMALDRNADAYEEIRPPSLVRTATMISTGHLPKFEEEGYHAERDDLWLVPTAEVPLTSLAADEILSEDALPMRLMAYTPCYRREAGAAGRDTRGLLRVHEFDKVEILAYATPEQASAIHLEILHRAEGALRDLGLMYRVVDLCTGDLGQSSARTFDLEVYAPGCDQWLEASSVSWFSDYQARRANIRYRRAEGGNAIVHTLNGSALAVPRVWAALVETHRQADGSVAVPEVLYPYMRGTTSIK